MTWLLAAGGVPGLFVALFGILALVSAALFARSPEVRRLDFLRRISLAALFSIGTGVAACFAKVLFMASAQETAPIAELTRFVMAGAAESLAPAITGFTLLSLAHFVAAVGLRRMPLEG